MGGRAFTLMCTYACARAPTAMHTRIHARARTHTHTHEDADKDTRTQTHTQSRGVPIKEGLSVRPDILIRIG